MESNEAVRSPEANDGASSRELTPEELDAVAGGDDGTGAPPAGPPASNTTGHPIT